MGNWIPAEKLRQVMRYWTTGVVLVTVADEDQGHGMTVNSFTSVSLDPALILVSLERTSRTHQLAINSGRFAVSILRSDQQEISEIFAGRTADDGDRFAGIDARTTPAGIPIPKESLAVIDCAVEQTIDAGTHTVFIARVEYAEVSDQDNPLLYFNRAYRKLTD